MKAIVIIPGLVAALLGAAVGIALLAGAHVHLVDPLTAAAIGAGAGMLGILPMLVGLEQKSLTSAVQSALIGTAIHLLAAVVAACTVIGLHGVDVHGPFLFWVIGAYWISLAGLIWQLRRLILAKTGPAKDGPDKNGPAKVQASC